ncbi:hypothetical protein [Geodermatophilus marinus]|uniref:hypothetical protein n=1 Tax=Geodermatophilus sp. LHW52908 TaxID=2303986 RepID=UPI000E3D49FF|nr:hypothetical protein [Geodermatophilus sp. LHW52908]RFU21750.1 hypothetical protein D0Z06_08865 [Geodermatophilus sp. LHW52908]
MARSRRIVLGLGAVALVAGAGLAVSGGMRLPAAEVPSASGTPTPEAAAPGTYGAPVPVRPEPTAVATDAPVVETPAPVTGGDLVLTYAGWAEVDGTVEAAGYVPGVVEDTGSCVLTLSRDGIAVETSSPASADATSTACSLLAVPGDQLAPGTWDGSVAYSSPTSTAVSEPFEVVVP